MAVFEGDGSARSEQLAKRFFAEQRAERRHLDYLLDEARKKERQEILEYLKDWEPEFDEDDEYNTSENTWVMALDMLEEDIKTLKHKK